MSFAPGKLNDSGVAGDTYRKIITWKTGVIPAPVDLTGCSARVTLRLSYTDAIAVQSVPTLGGVLGTISVAFAIPANATAKAIQFVWDCELILSNGDVQTLYTGFFEVLPGVSQ